MLSYEAWYGFLQMKYQTIRRLVRRVTCPLFASPPPYMYQSSDIFLILQKTSVNFRCSAEVHSPKDSRNSEQKKGSFSPNSRSYKWHCSYAFHSAEANLLQGPLDKIEKKNHLLLCYKQSAEQQGSLHLEHKKAFGTIFKAKKRRSNRWRRKGMMEGILKITKAQLDKLPVGEKAPQMSRRKCSHVLHPALRS